MSDVTLHPAYRRRAGDGPVFTSRKCPNGPGLKHTCELPFGFVWTPMSPSPSSDATTTTSSLPPVLCLNCLSYLNLYATEQDGLWTCPLCGYADNVLPQQLATTSPAMVSPMVEYRQTLQQPTDASSSFIIVLDANLGSQEAHAVAASIQNLLLQQVRSNTSIQLALVTFDKTVSIFQLGMTAGVASADVIQPQDDMSEEDFQKQRNHMASRFYFTTIQTEADLATFGSCISAVFGSGEEEPKLSRKEMLKRKREARLRGATATVKQTVDSPWIPKPQASRPARCTGEAIQCAIDVATTTASSTCRILLFTNGCPNIGNGTIVRADQHKADVIDQAAMLNAIQYFEATGAADNSIGMDVFLSGAGSLGLQAYQALVDPSGGYALPHDSFTSTQFAANLDFCVSHTFVSRGGDMDGCTVDVRMSEFVSPSHVVGAMEVVATDQNALLPNERSAFATALAAANQQNKSLPNQDILADTLTRVRMGRYDPLSTLSFMLRVNESTSADDKYAFFQCTLRYLEQDGKTLVTKVSTHRLPVARSVHDFLDSMDEEVVPIVLGKEAVFRSIVGRDDEETIDALVADADRVEQLAFEAQKDLDNTIHRISGAYRLIGLQVGTGHKDFVEDGGVSSAHSSLGFAFPPELADAVHRLFHLRRGSMLSPGPVRSMDDRAEIRNLYLRLPLDDCLCMMAPSLWGSGVLGVSSSSMLDPIPSDTMTLWDSVSVLPLPALCQQHG